MNKQEYEQYLGSPHWKAVRMRKLSDTPFCEYCGKKTGLDVHHASYTRLNRENLDKDLIVLCRDCHTEEHGNNPSKYERGLEAFARNKYGRNLENLNIRAVEREFRWFIGIDRRQHG